MRAALHGTWLHVAIAVIGLSLAGRAESRPTYRDPFDPSLSPTAQSAMGRASAGPSVRVILAGSTGASMKDLADQSNSFWVCASFKHQHDPQHFQDALNRILASGFRSIEYVYWNAPESRSQVDYILTLDIRVTAGRGTFMENRVDLQGVLSVRDGEHEILVGHGRSRVGFPACTQQRFMDASQAAFDEFAQNLSGSRLLAAYKGSTPASTEAQRTLAGAPPSSPAVTDATRASSQEGPQKSEIRGGLYDVESKISFNVLESVYFDAASGELALIGHHDNRFKQAGIPYLQHLATLLESPKPEFSLAWTPESSRRVDSLLARELTQQESDEQGARLGAMVGSSGLVTHTGTLMLPPLGIFPIAANRAPGDLGVEVQSINGGRVVIMKVKPGSAAERAGLKPADFINSVRPDRPVFFASEFERQVRFAGAGAEIEVSYQRGGEAQLAKATLDAAADPNPWHEVNRYDVVGIIYRAEGDRSAADVVESLGIMNMMAAQKEQTAGRAAYGELMHSLGMDSDFQHLQEVAADGAPPYEDSYSFGLKLSRQLDSIFHLTGNPLQNLYESTVRQSHDPSIAVSQVFDEFDRQFKPKIGELFDRLIFRPGVGFQIPPELVEEEYHIHPEMTPEYLGVPRDSQLARLMLASDYLGKQLSNRQDLRGRIPGYQTQIEYRINHPEANRRANTAHRLWISVADMNAAQSPDGKTLALREVRMRFNIRETDSQQNDLPDQHPGGYEDVLTGLYDRFEEEFSTLHELREAAKLAAVAVWMQQQNPAIRLPAEGRASWKGPERLDGLVYIYLTVNQRHESKIIKIAEGGVSLKLPAGNGAMQFPIDSSVVDLRGSPGMTTIFTRPDTAIVRTVPAGTSAGGSPYAAGWVAPLASGAPGQEAVVLAVGADSSPNHQLNAIARNAQLIATNPGSVEAESEGAQPGFDTGAKGAGAVDASVVQAPSSAPEDIQIPDNMLKDPELAAMVLQLTYFKQQSQKLHEAATAAQEKFQAEQRKDPHSDQVTVLQVQAKEAQDKAGNLDNMVKFQTSEVKRKIISFRKIETGEDGKSTPQDQAPPAGSPPAGDPPVSPPRRG